MQKIKQSIVTIRTKLTPKQKRVIAGVPIVVLGAFIGAFLVPRHITYSYSGQSCASTAVLLPGLLSESNDAFDVTYQSGVPGLLATRACATPTATPKPGTVALRVGVFGNSVFAQAYRISVPGAPTANRANDAPVATTKSMQFNLSAPDTTFRYALTSGGKTSKCTTSGAELYCPMTPLNVKQGAEYEYELTRSFAGAEVNKVVNGKAKTLDSVTLTSDTIAGGATLYGLDKTFVFTANKPLTKAEATLAKKEGESYKEIPANVRHEGAQLIVSSEADLPRESEYRLTVAKAEAIDGSDIEEPVAVAFAVSGGPKVTGVSIGANGVNPGQQVVVTFDQPITAEAAKLAKAANVNATVVVQGAQLMYRFQGGDICAEFSLSIAKGVVSAVNKLPSKDTWNHTSRFTCRVVTTIGSSVKGRAITAYHYGGGNRTVLINGNIHGNERSTYQTMMALVQYLDGNAHRLPADRRVVVVPSMNPDGYAANTRNNARNVNLARNYPTSDWKADIHSANGFVKDGGGTEPASEPETKAMMRLIGQTRPGLMISFHSQGSLVGSNSVGGADAMTRRYAAAVGYRNMIGNAEEVMGYTITGEFEAWVGATYGTPAILVELPSHGGNYFRSHQAILWKFMTE